MARWVLNPVALYKATKKLKITTPVSIKTTPNAWWAGWHASPLHVLWINEDLKSHDHNDPSWTIWHELGHALQCEREFNGDIDYMHTVMDCAYSHLVNQYGKPIQTGLTAEEWYKLYYKIPWEVEAESYARLYAERYPLVKIKA